MPMSDCKLSSLVVRAQTGDRAAYDDIVLRFQDMAVGYATALLGDFHQAEDAAQEAFVGAWTGTAVLARTSGVSRMAQADRIHAL